MSPTEEIIQVVRENRSSESNFDTLLLQLERATEIAQQKNDTELFNNLKEVREKYTAEYQRAKESGGTAWPEFEKFVTQFERALNTAAKSS